MKESDRSKLIEILKSPSPWKALDILDNKVPEGYKVDCEILELINELNKNNNSKLTTCLERIINKFPAALASSNNNEEKHEVNGLDKNENAKLLRLQELTKSGDAKLLSKILTTLKDCNDETILVWGLENICKYFKSDKCLAFLAEYTKNDEDKIRIAALKGLAESKSPKAVPIIVPYASDQSVAVSGIASTIISEHLKKESLQALKILLKSKNKSNFALVKPLIRLLKTKKEGIEFIQYIEEIDLREEVFEFLQQAFEDDLIGILQEASCLPSLSQSSLEFLQNKITALSSPKEEAGLDDITTTNNDDFLESSDKELEENSFSANTMIDVEAELSNEQSIRLPDSNEFSTNEEEELASLTQNKDLSQIIDTPQEKPSALEENPGALEEKPDAIEEKPVTLEEKASTIEENPSVLEENPGALEENPGTQKPGAIEKKHKDEDSKKLGSIEDEFRPIKPKKPSKNFISEPIADDLLPSWELKWTLFNIPILFLKSVIEIVLAPSDTFEAMDNEGTYFQPLLFAWFPLIGLGFLIFVTAIMAMVLTARAFGQEILDLSFLISSFINHFLIPAAIGTIIIIIATFIFNAILSVCLCLPGALKADGYKPTFRVLLYTIGATSFMGFMLNLPFVFFLVLMPTSMIAHLQTVNLVLAVVMTLATLAILLTGLSKVNECSKVATAIGISIMCGFFYGLYLVLNFFGQFGN